MSEVLVIVESPAKAKTIEKILGKKYKVTASAGHLRDLPQSKLGVDIENDFAPQYINVKGKAELIKKLKEDSQKASKVILATDPDREGEAISWHLAYLLGIDGRENCRVTFNEITEKAVKQGFEQPRPIDINLVDTYQARRVLDRIVGYKLSPLLWKKVKKGLSAGRVQSVAVRIICDKEKEIDSFETKEFWTIDAELSKQGLRQKFTARFFGDKKGKISLDNGEQADAIIKKLEGCEYNVDSVKFTEKKKSPQPPFTTSTLQQEASRKLSFSSKKTMSVAQQLYEGVNLSKTGQTALVTYIRTDSMRISDDAAAFAASLISDKYGKDYLPPKRRFYKNKNSAQDAHEAIRPAHPEYSPESVKDQITTDQYRLYKLIYERFIASQMADCILDVCSVDINAGEYVFKTGGQTVKFDGYTVVYSEGRDEGSEEEDTRKLPKLSDGEILDFYGLKPQQHFTQPPLRYTEATLIKALEEYGIGRPSTYAPTLSTIQERNYVSKEKKFLFPTELGKVVNDLLEKSFEDIVDVKFTASVESKFDEIEEGKRNWVNVIREFYDNFSGELSVAEKELEHVKLAPKESDVICEKCGRKMVYRMGKFGEFLACPGFPECRNTKAIIENVGVACPKCGRDLIYKKTKTGKKFISCSGYPECSFSSWNVPTGNMCPCCGEPLEWMYINRRKFEGCNNKECEKYAGIDLKKTAAARKSTAKKTAGAKTTARKKSGDQKKTGKGE